MKMGDPYLNLDIPVTLDNDYAQFGVRALVDIKDLEKNWLEITNARLRDDDLLNDTSYNASFLSPAQIPKPQHCHFTN